MSIDNENNNKSEIPLKLPKVVEDSKIMQKFVIDPKDQFVKLRLNSVYNLQISIDVPLNLINEKNGWRKFTDEFKNLKKTFKNIDSDRNIWIYSTLNENGSLIRSYVEQNQKQHQQQSEQFKEDEDEEQQNQESITEEIPSSEWSIKLVEKYTNLQKEILYLIPELWEPIEFALSVRSILRIKSITLPFGGIVLGPSSSLKSATVELFRNTKDTYYSDSFSAKSFVLHNTAVPKGKLVGIDLLPKIKDKLFLTPELSHIL